MNAWIDQLADALDYMEWIGSVASDWPSIEENVGLLASAARLVLEGEDIWWCEVHVSKGSEPIDGYALCWYAANQLAQNQRSKLERCRMVLMRLIAVPDTEEKT